MADEQLYDPPKTGLKAMKEKKGNQFFGELTQFEDVESGFFEDDGETPKRNYCYTFTVLKSNFSGMAVGASYRLFAPTRFDREMRKWLSGNETPESLVGYKFEITYDGDERTSKGGKAANFTIRANRKMAELS